jgi:hypothetical protein
VQINVIRGILARKSSNETTSAETGFVPLTAGVYPIGSEVEGRLEVLRGEKPTVYLPMEKLRDYEAAGEIEVIHTR